MADDIAGQAQAWLAEHWDPGRSLLEWRNLLADSGWGCPRWPVDLYGRGLGPADAAAVAAEFGLAGAVGPAVGLGMALAAPTLLEHGSHELKRRLLRPILTGEDKWCQLFSEPGNGSDLAGLTTHAVLDGDEWVVNGQKVWTTGARHAAYGLLLTRTNWEAPKHRGITFFAFPMRQDGVEVRPLRQMNNHASFNEVFISDARVPAANVVGEVDGGWRVAVTTLSHERGLAGVALAPSARPDAIGRTARDAAAEAAEYAKTYEWYPQRAGRPDLIAMHSEVRGKQDDPVIRQRVAALAAFERAARWTAERTRGAPAMGSVGKLAGSEIARRAASLHGAIAGPAAMLTEPIQAAGRPDPSLDGIIAEVLISVPAGSIAGGTDEIQRNIVGERVLGLPREPSVDADLPFRAVRTNPKSL